MLVRELNRLDKERRVQARASLVVVRALHSVHENQDRASNPAAAAAPTAAPEQFHQRGTSVAAESPSFVRSLWLGENTKLRQQLQKDQTDGTNYSPERAHVQPKEEEILTPDVHKDRPLYFFSLSSFCIGAGRPAGQGLILSELH